MAALIGYSGQRTSNRLFDASGTITTNNTAQLVLPLSLTRSSLIIENISAVNMFVEFGAARATATLSGGTVSACTVTNAGFGYSRPPSITFLGGNNIQQAMPTYTLQGLPEWTSPNNFASAHCVMTGAAGAMTISSIVIDNPGSGYAYPPIVLLTNDPLDPYGCAASSATSGILLLANGGSYTSNGSVCTTDQVSIFCATSTSAFVCKYTQ